MNTTTVMIMRLLKTGPKNLNQLTEELGLLTNTIQSKLWYMVKTGKVKRDGKNYFLVE